MEPQAQDPLYEKAKLVAQNTPRLCVANIQRTMAIGYNRATALMTAMVNDGLVEKKDSGLGGFAYRWVGSDATN